MNNTLSLLASIGLTISIISLGCSGKNGSDAQAKRDGANSNPASATDTKTPAGTKGSATSDPEPSKAESSEASRPTTALSGQPPAEDDTLVAYYANDPDTLNVIMASDNVSFAFHRLLYDYLAERKFDNPDEFEPRLAESWEFDPDKLEYTIKLRKGVMWHPITMPDGTVLPPREMTAADVKFTFDCILNPHIDAGHIRSYYEDPDAKDEADRYKIKVSLVPGDKYTIKVKWTKPYFAMEEYTLFATQIIPRHVYSIDASGEPISFDFSSKEFADGFNSHWANTKACGTGPLKLKEWEKDQQVVFERNPDYWGNPFYFSRMIYRNISNSNTALQQVLQNELDWGPIAEKDLYVQSRDHANVKSGKVILEEFFYPAYRYMGYNLNREFFKDKRVRWAIGHAVPVDQIIDKLYYGLADRTTGPFLPGSPSYDETLKPLEFDLDKARKLLDEAGWVDSDKNGIRDKEVGGTKVDAKFDLMIYADSPGYQTIAEIIKENCRKIGVDVQITPAKWALMLQKLRKKEFDATILGWVMGWQQDPFQLWHGSQADVPETSNHVGYKNPQVDALIEELRVTLDSEKQAELGRQIHRALYDDQPFTFLFCDKQTAGKHQRLENVKFYKLRPAVNSREWGASTARPMGR